MGCHNTTGAQRPGARTPQCASVQHLQAGHPEASESEALSSAILDEMDVLEAFAPDTPPQPHACLASDISSDNFGGGEASSAPTSPSAVVGQQVSDFLITFCSALCSTLCSAYRCPPRPVGSRCTHFLVRERCHTPGPLQSAFHNALCCSRTRKFEPPDPG